MPLLADLLAYIDSRKRVAGRNLRDIVENPTDALTKTAYQAAQTIPEYVSDPMNFVGGGVGSIAKKAAGRTEYEVAHEIAQRNAALPVEQGGLGLPPNNTAMDRARAMGFYGGIYHGGTNDFPAFSVSERRNVYATDEPRIADIYANATGRHKALREINAGSNVIPLMYRGKLAEVSDQGVGGGGWYRDNLAQLLGVQNSRNLVKEVPEHGFSGVKVSEMDDLGGSQSQYIFPDPSVLRSRFAAFDPTRRNENNLLASVAPYISLASILGISTDMQERD